jgi:MFS family permease
MLRPPNKLTEVLWGVINCIPTLVLTLVIALSPSFKSETHDQKEMIAWLISLIVLFAVIFAINSSIHSYLVVKYAKEDKVAVSVGFYYMSNAVGRLVGTLGSGVLYTFVGRNKGMYAGTDSTSGLAACFLAGTLSSLLAAIITLWIDDQGKGLKCGPCTTLVPNKSLEEEDDVIIEAGGD